MKADERIKGHQGYGLIQLIHGTGKGKTTAALGQAIRCAGSGRRVAIIYFDKGGKEHYSERGMLDKIDNIDYFVTGRDRIDEKGRFDFSITDEDRKEAERGLKIAEEKLAGDYDLVVLDEINSTCDLGMINLEDLLNVINKKNPKTEIILTGRNPHEKLLELAHEVSIVESPKHYFYSGVKAREGLDF